MNKNVTHLASDVGLPKNYKGYDMDVLVGKLFAHELTSEEDVVLKEAMTIWHRNRQKQDEENQKNWEAWKRAHPDEIIIRHVDPCKKR